MVLKFKKVNPGAFVPQRAHGSDSGIDVRSVEDVVIEPGERFTFSTGLAFVIPPGYEIQVRPRSSMAKRGIDAILGTVDNGYRGEVGIILANATKRPYPVCFGDKIAQLVLAPVALDYDVEETDILDETERGVGGFGSTGR